MTPLKSIVLFWSELHCPLPLPAKVAQMVKNLPGRPEFNPWVGKIPWRREWLPTPVVWPEDSIDRGAWRATAHGITKSQTQLSI